MPIPLAVPPDAVSSVTMILNERLAGLTLSEVRASLPERLRDACPDDPKSRELMNIFMQSAEELSRPSITGGVVMAVAQGATGEVLAEGIVAGRDPAETADRENETEHEP